MTTRGFHKPEQGDDDSGRVPPGQSLTADFPVLSAGPTPNVKLEDWRFTLKVGPRIVKTWSWQQFSELPRTSIKRDIHCVTTWSKLDTRWRGVLVDDILAAAGLAPPTPYTLVHSSDGYSTNVPVADLIDGRAMVATHYAGQPLTSAHGGPARMLVPHLYFWKSAKWVSGIQFTEKDVAGFWELRGYHMYGDPWREQRFAGDDAPRADFERSANQWRPAEIDTILPETARATTFRLRPESWIGFTAGQYLEVRLSAENGYRAERFYSIGSAPDALGVYELTIDRLPGGEVSSWFHDEARTGDRIEIRGPFGGQFVWQAQQQGPLLLIGGGSGIVPLMSIIRHRARVAPDTPALLLYGARSKAEAIFCQELLKREQWEPHFSVVFAFSQEEAERETDFSRRIDGEIVAAALQRLPERPAVTYLCGSNGFVEPLGALLVAAGLAPDAIRIERFGE